MIQRALIRLSVTISLVFTLAGCGEDPLQPMRSATGPEILVIDGDNSVQYTTSVDGTGTGAPSQRAVSASAEINGADGGRIRCGRYVVAIPPGAYDGVGTITVSMPDSTVMAVDLSIAPAELNDFKVPVKLCLITEGTSVDPKTLSLYWYDPMKRDWVALPSDEHLDQYPEVTQSEYTQGTLTDLSHFSRYSGGKAGW